MTPRRLEQDGVTDDDSNDLGGSSKSCGAESGAVLAGSVLSDVDLRLVVKNWGKIPGPVKAGILAMVRSAAEEL
jgi:hypothetical protein